VVYETVGVDGGLDVSESVQSAVHTRDRSLSRRLADLEAENARLRRSLARAQQTANLRRPAGSAWISAAPAEDSTRSEANMLDGLAAGIRRLGGLQAATVRLEIVLDSIPAGILLAEAPGGRIVYGNQRVADILRHPVFHSPDVEHYSEWVGWHPDGRRVEGREWPLARALLGEFVWDSEILYRRGDATTGWIKVSAAPVRDDGGAIIAGVVTLHDIDAQKQAEEQRTLLLHELNHRVKNTLATIQSIAAQTAQGSTSVPEFVYAFQARLMAISHTHNLLTVSHWQGAELHAILADEIAPYSGADGASRVRVEGEPITLPPGAALMAGLVFHELVTNAAKYGALSVPGGRVAVTWEVAHVETGRRLRLRWVETGGPAVSPPLRRGFGSKLIERGLTQELDGRVQLDFAPQGLHCTMDLAIPEEEV